MARALLLCLMLAAPAWADPDAGEEADAGVVVVQADEGEAEVQATITEALADAGVLYSSDLTDEELTRRWVEDPESLGSINASVRSPG